MNPLLILSSLAIPVILFVIVTTGLLRKVEIYSCFIKGAKEGFATVIKIMPTLVGLMIAVGVLRASGFLEFCANLMKPLVSFIQIPPETVPVLLIKMFSSSAATGLVLDLFDKYGPDSYIGNLVSLAMSSTETIFYTMSVYFMAAKVNKSRYTLTGALICTAVGILASIFLAKMM